MEVKILENFYFMGKLYKMGTSREIQEEYHQFLKGKIEPIEQEDYNSLTKKQIQKALDNKSVEYSLKSTKAELLALLGGA